VLQNIENESKIAHFQANKRQRQGTTSPKTWQTFQAPILYACFYSTLNEDASFPLQSSSSVERTSRKHFSVQGGDGGQVLKPNFMTSKKIELCRSVLHFWEPFYLSWSHLPFWVDYLWHLKFMPGPKLHWATKVPSCNTTPAPSFWRILAL